MPLTRSSIYDLDPMLEPLMPPRYQPFLTKYNSYNPVGDNVTAWYNGDNWLPGVGNGISQLTDLSGNDYHYIQNTAANQPKRGLRSYKGYNAILFDGLNTFMSITSGYQPGANNSMVLAIVEIDDSVASNNVFRNQAAGSTRHGMFIFSIGNNYIHSNAFTTIQNPDTIINQGYLFSGYKNGTEQGCGINGVYTTNNNAGTCPTIDSWTLGAGVGPVGILNGVIAELLVYLSYDADVLERATEYLNIKYNMGF